MLHSVLCVCYINQTIYYGLAMFQMVELLLAFACLQSSEGRRYCDCRSGLGGSGTTSYNFHAGTPVPDPHNSALHFGFTSEGTSVLGVLADFNFLHHSPEGGIKTGPIFTRDSDLRAFSLVVAN